MACMSNRTYQVGLPGRSGPFGTAGGSAKAERAALWAPAAAMGRPDAKGILDPSSVPAASDAAGDWAEGAGWKEWRM